MRRRTAVIGAAALLVILALPVDGRTYPGVWSVNVPRGWVSVPVENQTPGGATQPDPSLWTVNPTINDPVPCAYDADDEMRASIGASALLRPGESAAGSWCSFADWTSHAVALRNSTPGLLATLTLPGHVTLTVPGGQTGCIAGPVYRLDRRGTVAQPQFDPGWDFSPLLLPLAGTAGGVGVRHDFTFRVTNPTSKRMRNVFATSGIFLAGFAYEAAPWCPFPWHQYWTPLYPAGADPQVWVWVG